MRKKAAKRAHKHERQAATNTDSTAHPRPNQPKQADQTLEYPPDLPYVPPKSIERHLRWKRRRENWVPFILVVIAIAQLIVLIVSLLDRRVLDQEPQITQKILPINDRNERIDVRVADLKANFVSGEIMMMIENGSARPAKNIKVEAREYRISNKLVGSETNFDAGSVSLFRGSSQIRLAVPMSHFGKEEARAIQTKAESLAFAGKIDYEDAFGSRYSTKFAFEYRPSGVENWIPTNLSLRPNDLRSSDSLSQQDHVSLAGMLALDATSSLVRRKLNPSS